MEIKIPKFSKYETGEDNIIYGMPNSKSIEQNNGETRLHNKAGQSSLFPDLENEIEKEWQDMPEFSHENKEPVKQLIVSFKNFDDYKEFGKLVNQPLTRNTQSIWFPKAEIERYIDKRYTDES